MKNKKLSLILCFVFLFLSVWISFVFYKKLTPNLDPMLVRRENPHRVIARQGLFVLEKNGGNILANSDDVVLLNSKLSNIVKEHDTINSFPFITKWLLKFKIDIILKNVYIKNLPAKIIPEVVCNNKKSENFVISSERKITIQDYYSKLLTSFPSLLNNCSVNVTSNDGSALPNEYVVIESYGFKIRPVFYINFSMIFIVVIFGLFALLPLLREGFKFFKNGLDYFKDSE